MDIFVFSSTNLTNIWAGIGARLWAVSQSDNPSTAQGRKTKAQNVRIRSFGILYCSETHSLTTPFIVYSKANRTAIIDHVWQGKWVLPFRIFPLGSPDLQLSIDEAKSVLPSFKRNPALSFSDIFHVQAITVFSPSTVGADDWEELIRRLATDASAMAGASFGRVADLDLDRLD